MMVSTSQLRSLAKVLRRSVEMNAPATPERQETGIAGARTETHCFAGEGLTGVHTNALSPAVQHAVLGGHGRHSAA